jgi:hypothetical protein
LDPSERANYSKFDSGREVLIWIPQKELTTASLIWEGRYRLIWIPQRQLNYSEFVRLEVFTAVTMKNGVFWDVTPCGSCKNRRFGRTYPVLHQGDKNRTVALVRTDVSEELRSSFIRFLSP